MFITVKILGNKLTGPFREAQAESTKSEIVKPAKITLSVKINRTDDNGRAN